MNAWLQATESVAPITLGPPSFQHIRKDYSRKKAGDDNASGQVSVRALKGRRRAPQRRVEEEKTRHKKTAAF